VTQYSNSVHRGLCKILVSKNVRRFLEEFYLYYIFTECTSSQVDLEILTSWSLRSSAILGSYSGTSLRTFRNNLSFPSSKFNKSREKFSSWNSWSLNMRPIRFPETSAGNCHFTTHNTPEDRRSHIRPDGSLKTSILTLSLLSEITKHSPFRQDLLS